MMKHSQAMGIEINPKLVGVLFTDKIGDTLRIFCYYTNGETSQFDVPDEDNRNSLRALLTALKTDETCTSVILDEVVQGRVYVQSNDDHWLYTLLKLPGSIPPPFNADLADLPWQTVWRSQETEVLRYQPPDSSERCMAIRTRLGENDAARLIANSKAFKSPVSVPRRQPQRWVYLNLAIVLVALGVLVAGTFYYTSKHKRLAAQPVASKAAAIADTAGYYLLYNHQISGPFPAGVLKKLSAGGLLHADTLCRADQSTDWVKLTSVFPPLMAQK